MSEYQYYEFLAVDHELDDDQQAELRALSTRADITATRFTNEYHWGSFGGNPMTMMERYFDAHLYVANWGIRSLMIKLPEQLLDLETAQRYCPADSASAWQHGAHVILSLYSDDEDGGDWDESDETRLGELIPVRVDLAAGDHRALYLCWLLAAQTELDEEELEPPVPPGLNRLTDTLRALAEFLRIDDDLLAIAAQASGRPGDVGELAEFVKGLPQRGKDALLVRSVTGDPHVAAEVRRRFRRQFADIPAAGTRTVGELLQAATTKRTEREGVATARAAAEALLKERARAEARELRLEALAADEENAWREVAALIESKRPAGYDDAVVLLADLKAVSARTSESATFAERFAGLRAEHRRKPSLLERFERSGL
ncbi:hypothetical protein AB0C38_23465 [Amycolatopsis sp. NPDC048633]|uniref:hypothetical protein n=1 Tax=Amycolatopsis sp. NPDC048633 TaxID=3157095 RepID=UPI00340EBC4F